MSAARRVLPQLLKCRSITSQNLKLRRNFSTTKKNRSSAEDWFYRDNYHPSAHEPSQILLTKLVGGCFWYWVLYHCWHEPEMLFGEFPYQEPSSWTDEELGIPPDDYEG